MELNVMTNPIGQVDTVFDSTVEYPFDLDVHLPEYMPELERSLKCDMTLNLRNTSYSADRVSIEGEGLVRILYVTSDKNYACFEQTLPISKSVQGKSGWTNIQIQVFPKLDYVNCRVVNQRKVSIHGVITLRVVVKSFAVRDMIVGIDCDLVQKKTIPMEVFSPMAYAVRTFSMSEVITLPDDRGLMGRVIQANSCVTVDSTKTVKNKLLIKGELIVDVLYTVESETVSCANLRHVMPISQIVEADGIEEGDEQDLTLRVVAIEVVPKADGNGDAKLLDISAKIEASLLSGKNSVVNLITDAYSTKGTLETEFENVKFTSFVKNVSDSVTESCQIDMSADSPKEILFVSARDVKTEVNCGDDNANVICSCTLDVLFLDAQNEINMCEKTISFEYKQKLPECRGDVLYTPNVQLLGCTGAIAEDGMLNVNIEVRIDATVFQCSECKALKRIALDVSVCSDSRSPLTIYFASAGECIWNIARHYQTTVSAIQQENALEEETISESRMLIIPTV